MTGDFNAAADGVTVTIKGDCQIAGNLNLGGGISGGMSILGNLTAYNINLYIGSTLIVQAEVSVNAINISGASLTTGGFTCGGNFNAGADGVIVTINGNCQIAGNLNLGGGISGNMLVNGNLEIVGLTTMLANSILTCSSLTCNTFSAQVDGVSVTINGDCSTSGPFSLGGGISGMAMVTGSMYVQSTAGPPAIHLGPGAIFTSGQLTCVGNLTANVDGAIITINGDCQITSALILGAGVSGTMTVTGNLETGAGGTIAAGATVTCLTLTSTLTAGAGTLTVLLPSTGGGGPTDWDAIYFDFIHGGTLGGGNDGSPSKPLNNETDVLIQLGVKLFHKIVMNPGVFTWPSNLDNIQFIGIDSSSCLVDTGAWSSSTCLFENVSLALIGGAIAVPGNLQCPGIMVLDGGLLTIGGDCETSGPVNVGGGTSGSMVVYGKLNATGGITLATSATLTAGETFIGVTGIVLGANAIFISASLTCEGAFTANTDGVMVTINGDCQVAGAFSLGGGTSGTAMIAGTLSAELGNSITLSDGTVLSCGAVICDNNLSNTTGSIYIYGDCKVANNLSNTTGSITIYGDTKVGGGITNTTGSIYIPGSAEIGGDLSNTTGTIDINGDCKISGDLLNTTGGISISGDTKVGGSISNTIGIIYIYGNCQVAGALNVGAGVSGTMTVTGNLQTGNGGTIAAGATVTCLTLTSTLTAGAGTLNVLIPSTNLPPATVLYPAGITVAPAGTTIINNSVLVIGDVIVGAGGTFTINGDCQVTGVFNAFADGVNININGDCQVAGGLSIGGGFSGYMTVVGNLGAAGGIILAAGASLTSIEALTCGGFNANADGVTINVYGDCQVATSLYLGAGVSGTMIVTGNLQTGSTITLAASSSLTSGPLECGGGFNASADGVAITIGGDCQIAGALGVGGGISGSMTVKGNISVVSGCTISAGATLTYVTGEIGGNIACAGIITGETTLIGAARSVDFTGSAGGGSISKLVSKDVLTLTNMSGDTIDSLQLGDASALSIDVSCTAGAVTIYGTGSAVNSSFGAGVTMTDKRLSIHVLP